MSKRIYPPTSLVLPSINDIISVHINNSDLEIHDSINRGEEIDANDSETIGNKITGVNKYTKTL